MQGRSFEAPQPYGVTKTLSFRRVSYYIQIFTSAGSPFLFFRPPSNKPHQAFPKKPGLNKATIFLISLYNFHPTSNSSRSLFRMSREQDWTSETSARSSSIYCWKSRMARAKLLESNTGFWPSVIVGYSLIRATGNKRFSISSLSYIRIFSV